MMNPTEKALDDALSIAEDKLYDPTFAQIVDIFVKRITTSSNFRYWEDVNNPGQYIVKCNGQAFVLFRDPDSDNEWFWDHYHMH